MSILSKITYAYNLITTIGWGMFFVFFYESLYRAWMAPVLPTWWSPVELGHALVRHPFRCLGGCLLGLGADLSLRGKASQRVRLLIIALVLSAVAVEADLQIFRFFSEQTEKYPAAEWSTMLYFNVGADLMGVALSLVSLAGLVPYSVQRWYQVVLLGAVSVMMWYDGIMFGENGSPSIFGALQPLARHWVTMQWKLYSASAFAIALFFAFESAKLSYLVAFALTFYAHLQIFLFVSASPSNVLIPTNGALGNAIMSGVGFILNGASFFEPNIEPVEKKKK